MAAQMEQQRAPELALACMEESKPIVPVDISASSGIGLTWSNPGIQPLKTKPTMPGGFSHKMETCPTNIQTSSSMGELLEEVVLPKPSDGLLMPNMNCDSVSPISSNVIKDLQFDSRFISDTWSYEAPQNMYALLTQPPTPMDPLAGGTGLVTPYMQLQAQQHLHLQQQHQQLDQHLDHVDLPLQMSPIHNSGLSSLYMSGPPLMTSPQQMMMQQPLHGSEFGPGFPTTPMAVNLSDIMASGDLGMFLSPSGSPANLVKQHMMSPMPHIGGVVNVKDLTLNELRPHFNKPMAVVAKELGVCITLMKKICRRNGLVRWPHRRIRSLVNRITSLQVLASNTAGAERKRFQGQIAGLREELSAVIQNPNEKSRKAQIDISTIPVNTEQLVPQEFKNEFPVAEIAVEMAGALDNEDDAKRWTKEKLTNVTNKAGAIEEADGTSGVSVQKRMEGKGPQRKKRKPSFGLHAYQPPPIKIPRHDELPSMTRLCSQSVPERKHRGERRYGRGRATAHGTSSSCVRPSTTTHRKGRRGSISSILNDILE
ncbi:unnamed protein product [Peronospora farinosa]|uniref:RWP-RK domain-containing protein n=1 Tax=Peronospora farinosa TaxID=134698 RepID=A0AAV0TI70_9STRA|nr:unnamed protein product [Peronospora farinosa]CAI5721828.1 unnamed protein product [Peronospora farinosa]